MSPEQAIANLVFGYAERLDAGDIDGVADIFSQAVVISMVSGGSRSGIGENRDHYRGLVRLHSDGTPRTKHVTTNLLIEVDEAAGTATCRSYYTVLQCVTDVLTLQPIAAGRYHDDFVRDAGTWRFARRRIFLDLVGEMGQHLLRGIGDRP